MLFLFTIFADIHKGAPTLTIIKPTAHNCSVAKLVSLEAELIDINGWLDPAKKPIIIMGNEEELGSIKVSEDGLTANDKYVWEREKWSPSN